MSLKSCYPYFKIPTLAMSDTWVMGLYDTCSYDGPSGRSVSTIQLSEIVQFLDAVRSVRWVVVAWAWPVSQARTQL